ncbi:hypothetical protein C5167_027046 [Papaver somniferum]|uniref:serine hydroxymethyltransferase, mitochondrial-like n=1 Tax=Papaver somniferum TaxID=3469 RepID=UPI000E6FA11B|nr:serine hydroxymethyltransferase, mitochondrial-like [Papaver somniferum]RZC89504.1 hypothetical protein C5167_027046 [Papaver somniferum]
MRWVMTLFPVVLRTIYLVLINLKNKGINGSRVEKVMELVLLTRTLLCLPWFLVAFEWELLFSHQGDSLRKILLKAEFFDAAVKLALKAKAECKKGS